MMSCMEFRAVFHGGLAGPAELEHLRRCDACLDHAVRIDPDVMFRAIGEPEMVPPGGVDAFVGDVMHAIELRSKEERIAPRRRLTWTRGWMAAAVAAGVFATGTLVYEANIGGGGQPISGTTVAIQRRSPLPTTTKPVVETYSSADATILEVPTEAASEVKIVMVIDESLPADL